MVEQGLAFPHHGHARAAVALADALEADEREKQRQAEVARDVAAATAAGALSAKRAAQAERHAGELAARKRKRGG